MQYLTDDAPASTSARTSAHPLTPEEVRAACRCANANCDCQGANANVHCPAHGDTNGSLSVDERDGKTLWKCHAGCDQKSVSDAIFKALGHQPTNNSNGAQNRPQAPTSGKGKPVENVFYTYADESGKVLFRVNRKKYEDGSKNFPTSRPDGNGGWVYGLGAGFYELTERDEETLWFAVKPGAAPSPQAREFPEVRRVLWNLPDVLKAEIVHIHEGEKAAQRHNDELKAAGRYGREVATTNPHGAGKWRKEYVAALEGKHIVIWPDNDVEGHKHAEVVCARCTKVAASVKQMSTEGQPKKGDICERFDAGATPDSLTALSDATPLWAPIIQESVKGDDQLVVTLGFPCTDTGNAERFVAQHGHKFLWSAALGWMMWDGARWTPDERGIVPSWEKTTVRSIYREAQEQTDERRPVVAKWAATSESSKARRAMMEAVQKDGPKAVPSDFDANVWLLNTLSGTLDLRTGDLRPHNRNERHSKLVPVRFDAKASCSLWIDTLLKIFNGDETLVRFLQVALGYSLTGLTREQCLFILYGKGANGKSLVLSIVRALLGDYQTHAAPATLTAKRGDAIPNDVAMLRAARLVTSIETSEGSKFDEERVKALTGDDPFTARFFRKEFFTFTPEFKIFLATNHKPQITGTDNGIWRRIRLVPFDVRFWDADKGESGPAHLRADKSLKDKILQHELPGILNWALDGCLAWQREGIPSPQSVRSATDNYRAESDVLAQFIEDCAVVDSRVSVPKGDFHKGFATWAKNNDLPPCSSLSLTNRMQEKGFSDKRGTGGTRLWLGIALLATDDKKAPAPNGRKKKAAY